MRITWLNSVVGVPLPRDFMTTGGLGSPLAVNTASSELYYLGAGDTVTPISGTFLNAKIWGAVGDGVTDDTSALQAALDGAHALGRGILFIPAGTYSISDVGLQCPNNMRLIGEGRGVTILRKKLGLTELNPILREKVVAGVFQPLNDLTIEAIEFYGNGDAATPSAKGAGLLRAYAGANWRIVGCSFHDGKGYGVGLEGAPSQAIVSKRGPALDFTFDDCHFYSNGKQAYLLGADTDDGIDFKTSDRLSMRGCRAWDNGDKGFDIRSRMSSFVACYSWDNAGAGFSTQIEAVAAGSLSTLPASASYVGCYAFDNGFSGFSVTPAVIVGVLDGPQAATFVGCYAINNSHNYSVASFGTLDLAQCRVILDSCTSRDPIAGTRHFLASAACELIQVNGGLFYGGTTHGISANNAADIGHLQITGAMFDNIGGSAITGSGQAAARTTITGCAFRNIGLFAATGHSNLTASGNNYENVAQAALYSMAGTNNRILDNSAGMRTVSSAATVTLSEVSNFFTITGSTAVTSITASYAGREVTIRFTSILTLTDGGNLILAGDFITASNSMIKLVCDGTNWYELSRSVN